MTRHPRAKAVSALLVVLVTACSGDATPSATATSTTLTTATSTPATAVVTTTLAPTTPTGGTPVHGTTACIRDEWSSETSGGIETVYEHFSCIDEMSDSRVSGLGEYDIATIFSAQGDDLAAPWTAEYVLSNDGGTWRGTCTGALDYTSDPQGLPMNYGICTLTGEGGYGGLSYVLLGAGGNDELVQAGWIEPAE